MNERETRLWIAALRSGEYVQGRNRLEQVSVDGVRTHCCLGVACRTAMADGVVLAVDEVPRGGVAGLAYYTRFAEPVPLAGARQGEMTSLQLPESVSKWLGLNEMDTYYGDVTVGANERGSFCASWVNDSKGMTFSQIADLLEQQLIKG